MPKIEIVEQDLTSPGTFSENTDVAYIPGFVDVKNNFNNADYKNALPLNVPTLFTSVASFESRCGQQPAKFATTQYYKDIGGMNKGFDEVAVPYNGVMFAEGDADPAYVMAKELLSMGLNVLYERVNPDVDDPDYIVVKASETAPENWDSIRATCDKQTRQYTDVLSAKMPELTEIVNGTEYNSDTTYMIRTVSSDDIVTYTKVLFDGEDKDESGRPYSDDLIGKDPDKRFRSVEDANHTYYKEADVYYLNSEAPVEYTKDTYYFYNSELGTYTLDSSETAPTGWPVGHYTFTKVELSQSQVEARTIYNIPDTWVEKWSTNGIVSELQWVANDGADFVADTAYRYMSGSINIVTMYNFLNEAFDAGSDTGLMDKGNYSFKYMTTGGYPVYEYNQGALVQKMLNVAANRGDCVAIIDHTDNINRDNNIDHSDSLYATVKADSSWKSNGEFATMFTPWATYNRLTTDKNYLTSQIVTASNQIRMPASFAYLLALADSIKTNANWLAIAGSARGAVLHLADGGMTTIIPNGAADRMQPRDNIAINPITNINPYGNIIWGNRTLKDNAEKSGLTATSFLNIRNLVSDVKKQCYRTARQLTFEQNNDILWINFKALMSPLLDRMLSGYGISGYKMVIDTENEHYNEKATLCVKIILFPVYAVEDFYITIVLKDEDISVEEA
mgnify:CR=1 FL=1